MYPGSVRLKVPTFQKYGLTKAAIKKSEVRDRKISDILTHHLTIGIGVVFGLVIYAINISKVQPSSFIQIISQVFLFASMGVICVGIPAVLFKFAEMFYFKHISPRSEEKKNIQKYMEDRDDYDFWKIRKDYSYWKVLDGLSFVREILNIHTYLDYKIDEEKYEESLPDDRIMLKDNSAAYFSFDTVKEVSDINVIDKLLELKGKNNCENVMLFAQYGFNKKVTEYAKEKKVQLNDINSIIKIVKTIPAK